MAQAKAKSNSVVTSAWDATGNILTIEVLTAGTKTFDRREASQACRDRAEQHGWLQRLADKAAMSRDPKTGLPATPQAKLDAIAELADWYMSGTEQWKMSGTGGGDRGGLLLEALCRYRKDKTRDELVAFLATKDARWKADMLNSTKILPIANAIRAERAADVDTDEMLDGIELDAE